MRTAHDALPRRGFLARLTAAFPLTALTLHAQQPATPPDERWLTNLTAKHRTVLDVDAHRNGHALTQAKNFLDIYERAYGVTARDINLVLGVHGTGLPIVFADAVWAKYRFGEQYAITDPASKAPSTRNLFVSANVQADGPVTAEQAVEALQRRGVLFLVCNNTVTNTAKKLAGAGFGTPESVRADLVAGLLPGVVLVPAMLIALNRMQERGVSYVYSG
jgi:intracellular sulfur oxidation DsrE/DsrF family protein